MEGLEQKGYVIQVEYLNNVDPKKNFDYFYHFMTKAENSEQALAKVNRHLLRNLNFDHFPDAFFARLSLVNDYTKWAAKPKPLFSDHSTFELKVFDLLSQYESEVGAIPIVDETIFFDAERERMAKVKEVIETEMKGYQVISEAIHHTEI